MRPHLTPCCFISRIASLPAKIHFHIVNQANIAYNNLCVSQTRSALCGSRDTNLCPALLPIVQGGTPLFVPDILNNILPQSHTDINHQIYVAALLAKSILIPEYRYMWQASHFPSHLLFPYSLW